MRPPLLVALLLIGCGGGSTSEPATPPAPVLDGLQPEATADIEPEVGEHLLRLAGEVGQLDFPSTREVIDRCRAGDAEACTSVGTRLMHGTWGLDKDATAAVPLFQFACEAGDLEGCHSLAVALRYGRGVDPDEASSVVLFQRACDGEHVVACSFLADAYRYGHGVEPDAARALAINERACLLGSFCYRLPELRLALLRATLDAPFADGGAGAACEAGDPTGCWWRALEEADGKDDDARFERVEALLLRSCDGGVGGACDSLGFHYLRRDRSPGFRAKAHDAFGRACALGVGCDHAEACPPGDSARVRSVAGTVGDDEVACAAGQLDRCLLLGIALKTGNGVIRDQTRAAELFERVCDGGDPHGCWYLGGALSRGEGLAEDDVRAAEVFRRACDVDHANGCVDLAFAHVHGRGVEQDMATAVSLFDKACGLGTACAHAEHYRQQLDDQAPDAGTTSPR